MTSDDAYILALLEQIAFNTQKGNLERSEYLAKVVIPHAASGQKLEAIHDEGVRADSRNEGVRIGVDAKKAGEPVQEKVVKKQNDGRILTEGKGK